MDISATTFLKQATTTAEHFGFKSIDTLKKHPNCKQSTKIAYTGSAQDRRNDALHGILTGGMNSYCDAKLHAIEAPTLFYSIDQIPRSQDAALSFHIFNVDKSIAEAILIQTTRALMNDLGHTQHVVRINSLGDKESSTRYTRELTNFLRKRLEDMPPIARELMKEHALTALAHLLEKGHELGFRSPNPLEFLSDSSRKHFREIVEFLDLADIPYEIDSRLIGHHECYSDALFSIDTLDDLGQVVVNAPLLVRGGRYSEFVERNTKQTISAVGAVMILKDSKTPARHPKPKAANSSVYVVQLGFGPKVRSLILIDELRRSGITVYQDLASDSLSTQLRDAEDKGVKYVIIIGQKEYIEKGVILRDMEARNQEQIDVPTLISKLRRSTRVPTVDILV